MTETKIKYARKSFGDPYACLKDWPEDCGVQCGGKGIVLPKNSFDNVMKSDKPLEGLVEAASQKESYVTAFFEAFPKNPSCFIRGEGKTIEEAEEDAFNDFQKILSCKQHEFEPRGRRDGYGYCKHCSLSMSGVLPILNKCCKCKTPTNWTSDDKGRYYCKKHARMKPKSKHGFMQEKKIPRKLKKEMKKFFKLLLLVEKGETVTKILMKGKYVPTLKAGTWSLDMTFGKRKMRKSYDLLKRQALERNLI